MSVRLLHHLLLPDSGESPRALAPLFLSGGPLIIICPHHCFNPPAPPPLDLTTPPSPLPLFVPVKPPPPPGRSPTVLLLLSRSRRRCDGGGCKKNSLLRKREQSLCPTTTTGKRETPAAVTGVGRLSVDSEQSQGMVALTGVWKRKKADHGRFSNPRKYAEAGGESFFPSSTVECGRRSLPSLSVLESRHRFMVSQPPIHFSSPPATWARSHSRALNNIFLLLQTPFLLLLAEVGGLLPPCRALRRCGEIIGRMVGRAFWN